MQLWGCLNSVVVWDHLYPKSMELWQHLALSVGHGSVREAIVECIPNRASSLDVELSRGTRNWRPGTGRLKIKLVTVWSWTVNGPTGLAEDLWLMQAAFWAFSMRCCLWVASVPINPWYTSAWLVAAQQDQMSWWIDGIEWGRAGQWDKPASLGAHHYDHRYGGWAHECFWCMCECVQVGAEGCRSESPSITLPPYSLLLYLSIKLRASLSDVCQLALGISLSLLAEAGITGGLPAHPALGWGGFPGILTPVIKFAHQVPWPLDIFPVLVMAFWFGFWKMELQSSC